VCVRVCVCVSVPKLVDMCNIAAKIRSWAFTDTQIHEHVYRIMNNEHTYNLNRSIFFVYCITESVVKLLRQIGTSE
jgi:hypothetical protein